MKCEAILGISAFFHDSAAVLIVDGKIIAAVQEERFSRIKQDAAFPIQAIKYVLEEAGIGYDELSAVAFYEKPLLKFERLLETYHAFAPRGWPSFLKAMPIWLKDKLFFRRMINRHLKTLGNKKISLYFPEHHLSHAASAFYPSPFEKAAILTIDGVGEWATMTIGRGEGHCITLLREQHFPHSLGLLYSAFTYYLGFEVNGGEYKVMGLAAYGKPESDEVRRFSEKIRQQIVYVREDGSLILNMDYFRFATHLRMTDDKKWHELLQVPRRKPEDSLEQAHADMAWAVQHLLEDVVVKLARTAFHLTKLPNLVMAGGVALNSAANGKLLELPEIERLWTQPAAGDAGGALGAAYAVWHIVKDKARVPQRPDAMQGAYLGPAYTETHIRAVANTYTGFSNSYFENEEGLLEQTITDIIAGKVVGWFQGRMEFGPRALGNRSILADPRHPDMQNKINRLVKFRESFRPFAPSVLEEDVGEYFELDVASPYMLLVRPVRSARIKNTEQVPQNNLMERLSQVRSDIPAVTHVDCSSRIQTVNKNTNPLFWKLLHRFKERTGYGLLINTSFNIKDEPIVCNPSDAIECFMKTGIDMLVMEHFVFWKNR